MCATIVPLITPLTGESFIQDQVQYLLVTQLGFVQLGLCHMIWSMLSRYDVISKVANQVASFTVDATVQVYVTLYVLARVSDVQ